MDDATRQIRRIDKAVEAALVQITDRIDDGKLATEQAACIACRLLESGIEVLSEVPYIDATEVEAAVLPVIVAVSERLRAPREAPATPRPGKRSCRLGGGGPALIVSVKRGDDPQRNDKARNQASHHPTESERPTMPDLHTRLRRLDQVIEGATADLLQCKHDESALDDLVVVGRRLLETAVDLLSHAPDLDLAELDRAFMGIVAATLDRPIAPPDPPRRRVRLLRLGPLTLTVERYASEDAHPDDEAPT